MLTDRGNRRRWERVADHLEALRPLHWIKNLLVFLPLVAAHRVHDLQLFGRCALAFMAFTLFASGVYLLNDLLDVESDRLHPLKRLRPLAAGRVNAPVALGMLCALVAAGCVPALLLSTAVLEALLIYFATMALYSLWAKRVPILDVMMLSGGYALRVVVGSLAAGIVPQNGLLAFCMFLFFSLALIKRYAELVTARHSGAPTRQVLGYLQRDALPIVALGAAAGYLAVLVLALDMTSGLAGQSGAADTTAWLACLLLFFWVSYMWLMAHRGRIQGDPVLYALRDPGSWIPLVLIAALCAVAP